MVGDFLFGRGKFGQPPQSTGSSISGTGNCSQHSQTCSGVGTIPVVAPAVSSGGGGGGHFTFQWWRDKLLKQHLGIVVRLSGSGAVSQLPQTCSGYGSIRFSGVGVGRQAHRISGGGNIRFAGSGLIERAPITMAGGGEMLFAGSGSVRVSMMPSISDEELAAILLTALD